MRGLPQIENMRNQLSIFFFLGFCTSLFAQNPHGAALKFDCAACHSPEGWEIAKDFWEERETLVIPSDDRVGVPVKSKRFRHDQTDFPLTGGHKVVDCRSCHQTLVFEEAQSDCISCHTDLHQMTAGDDCARCHSTNHWLVDNITALHQENGFPLLGQHAVADCKACHQSETALRFDRIGNDCINCHSEDYMSTTSPNHQAAGYSTNCEMCHDIAGPGWLWSGGGANHLFFPLTGGHRIDDCTRCHIGGNFINTPTDCFACHQSDFQATTAPDHEANNFPTDCNACHSTEPGWHAIEFGQHDQLYFPIFSGKHEGEWNQCVECHTTPGSFTQFSCIDCHEHNDAGDLANEHDEVSGYSYNSQACYSCHPRGN